MDIPHRIDSLLQLLRLLEFEFICGPPPGGEGPKNYIVDYVNV